MTTHARAVSLVSKYRIDPADQRTRIEWVRLSEADLALIRAAAPYLEPEADAIASEFYEHSYQFPGFVEKADDAGTTRERLEKSQAGYFRDLLRGQIDSEHFERSLWLGENHTRLDVKPRWVLGNYAMYAELVLSRLERHLEGEDLTRTFLAFVKLFSLEGSILTESYMGGLMDRMVAVYDRLGPSAGSLADSAGQVSSAAGEIAKAIQQVAAGASQQTGAVQVAASASESIKSALLTVTESARSAGAKSEDSTAAAEQGRRGAQETTDAMESI
ncbi:MAG: protoglobin domain-containing protein, partial [Polyangiaceae bacterium]